MERKTTNSQAKVNGGQVDTTEVQSEGGGEGRERWGVQDVKRKGPVKFIMFSVDFERHSDHLQES